MDVVLSSDNSSLLCLKIFGVHFCSSLIDVYLSLSPAMSTEEASTAATAAKLEEVLKVS